MPGLSKRTGAPPAIVWLDDPECTEPALVGNKCATLARLRQSGFCVPEGFCITTDALSAGVDTYGPALSEAARRLKSPWVARSSSTAEDSGSLAFPGLFCTVLDVADTHSLFESIENIETSTHADRVREYAEHHGVDVDTVRMAILVQTLIPATVAGVAFSQDPVSEAPHVVIESNYGLGETIVDGSVTPDSITIDENGTIIDRTVGSKEQKVITTTLEARVRRVPTSALEQTSFTLDDAAALQIAEVTRSLEDELGVPVDVEWALVEKELHVLQARPITTTTAGAS